MKTGTSEQTGATGEKEEPPKTASKTRARKNRPKDRHTSGWKKNTDKKQQDPPHIWLEEEQYPLLGSGADAPNQADDWFVSDKVLSSGKNSGDTPKTDKKSSEAAMDHVSDRSGTHGSDGTATDVPTEPGVAAVTTCGGDPNDLEQLEQHLLSKNSAKQLMDLLSVSNWAGSGRCTQIAPSESTSTLF